MLCLPRKRSVAAALCAFGLLVLASCSVIVQGDRCDTDADCAGRGAGAVCRSGACIATTALQNEAGAGGDCTTNAECVTRLGDEFAVCQKTTMSCTKLLSPDCTKVYGDYKNDRAIYIGTLFKQGSTAGDLGASPDAIAAIELAFDDFKNARGGLPDPAGGTARPLVAVECNQTQDPVRAAKHLSEDVKVPAIIGASTTYVTIQAATAQTINAGTFLISPYASSPGLADLDDKGLVWRTYPSDGLQAQAVPKLVDEIVASPGFTTPRNNAGRTTRRVAIVYKDDTYGQGLRDIILGKLSFNGKSAATNRDDGNLKAYSYVNTDDPANAAFDFTTVTSKVIGDGPFDIVMILGTSEAVQAFNGIESSWQDPVLPYYIMPDGIASTPSLAISIRELTRDNDPAVAAANSKALRRRIRGTIVNVFSGPLYDAFSLKFSNGNALNGSNAYDAAYTVAYSLYGVGSEPLTGANMAKSMAKLSTPGAPSFDIGTNGVAQVLQAVNAGGVTLNGTAGKLDFDLATGDVKATGASVWCLGTDSKGDAVLVPNTGETYTAATPTTPEKITGTFPDPPPPSDPCKFN